MLAVKTRLSGGKIRLETWQSHTHPNAQHEETGLFNRALKHFDAADLWRGAFCWGHARGDTLVEARAPRLQCFDTCRRTFQLFKLDQKKDTTNKSAAPAMQSGRFMCPKHCPCHERQKQDSYRGGKVLHRTSTKRTQNETKHGRRPLWLCTTPKNFSGSLWKTRTWKNHRPSTDGCELLRTTSYPQTPRFKREHVSPSLTVLHRYFDPLAN